MVMIAPSTSTEFSHLASDERIEATARALETNGFATLVVATGDDVRRAVLDMVPPGAEVFTSASRTLETTGLASEINSSGRYQAIRPRIGALDRRTHGREIQRLASSPDVVVGSVQAITERGQLVVASATGSQLASYASGAGRAIWVVGAQKLVRDLDEAMRRVEEYCLPLEDARARQAYGVGSGVNKVLVMNRELVPGRATVVLVKENLGF